MPDTLRNKSVLITGGSRGIGRAIALRLALETPSHIGIGYCHDDAAANRTVADVEALGIPCSAFRADVGKEDSLHELFNVAARRLGKLDVFISNAARGAFRPLSTMNIHTWQKMIDLNARAFLLGSQLAAKSMPNGGRIVGISSLGSRFCLPGYGGLGAAKAMIESMARYLAVELAPSNINVNVVCGGFVDTPSTRLLRNFDALAGEIAARTPAGRVATPNDLAGVIAFLCSPESDWIRGQTIIVDGGYSLSL